MKSDRLFTFSELRTIHFECSALRKNLLNITFKKFAQYNLYEMKQKNFIISK